MASLAPVRLSVEENDENLKKAWPEMRYWIQASSPSIPILFPSMQTEADKIRDWLIANKPLLNKVKRLDLNNLGLTAIPKEIALFKRIVNLSLIGNNIKKISTSIFNSNKELFQIFLQNNQIEELPQDLVTRLPKLRALLLNQNKIQKISCNCLKQFKALLALDLEQNPICEKFPLLSTESKMSAIMKPLWDYEFRKEAIQTFGLGTLPIVRSLQSNNAS